MKLFFLSALCFSAWAASPEILRVTPLAVVPGQKTVLTFAGSNLDSLSNLWTLFGPGGRRVTNSAGGVAFEVYCPEGRTGIEPVQAYGPDGASNFHLVLVDSLPTHTNSASDLLTPPIAVDGTFEPEKVVYYRFGAKAGQELSIELLAHRIGSQADPVVRILDAEDREVAFCDDEDGVWRDARLRFRAPRTAEYKLALHDIGYGGGAQYFYRLRLGDFPIIATSYPLRDWSESGTRELNQAPANSSPANPDPNVWFSELPMLMEREPNDDESAAQEFGVPSVLNGRFQSREDRDLFRFVVAKDQKLIFEARSRSLGSPCDVLLRIRKAGGGLVAENSGGNESEAALTHLFAEAGAYLLEARELTGMAPTSAPYRVKVTNWRPGFRLTSELNKLEVVSDGNSKLKIACERDGYEGEIQLRATGVQLENNIIPAKAKEAEITIKLHEPVEHLIDFSIEGVGTNGVVRRVSTRPALRKTFPLMLNPPPELDGRFAIVRKSK